MPDKQTEQQCAHPGCSCTVPHGGPHGKYCSEYCKEKGKQVELTCYCQHKECR